MGHHCHAYGCANACAPKLFACPDHWRALPQPFKAAIRREYVPGQERRKDPTARYCAVQRAAVAALAFRPNDERAARAAAVPYLESQVWRQRAIDAGLGDPLLGLPNYKAHEPVDVEAYKRTIIGIRQEQREHGEI